MIRIALDLEDFTTLINGGEINKDGAKLILKDIGFSIMQKALDDARGITRAALSDRELDIIKNQKIGKS